MSIALESQLKTLPEIRSPQNPRIKDLVRLRQGAHRRRSGLFLIEGRREIHRALEAGVELRAVFLSPECFPQDGAGQNASEALLNQLLAHGVEVVRLSPDTFGKAAFREGPDGFLGLAASWGLNPDSMHLPKDHPALILALEGVEKPGNLGTLIRTGVSAGIDALLLVAPRCDLFNPSVVRASQGALFGLSAAVMEASPARQWLRSHGIQCLAATPGACHPYWSYDYTRPTAILLGSESNGLTASWLTAESGDVLPVSIPMPERAGVDSLNVSAAGAVLLFEAVRQRSQCR